MLAVARNISKVRHTLPYQVALQFCPRARILVCNSVVFPPPHFPPSYFQDGWNCTSRQGRGISGGGRRLLPPSKG